MRWIKLMILALFGAVSIDAKSGDELWLLEQDFVKFGKKEVYEATQMQIAKKGEKGAPFETYALQDTSNPEYLYLTPVKTYAGLDTYLSYMSSLHRNFSDQATLRQSCLNFVVRTLYAALASCSSLPHDKHAPIISGVASYFVFGILPGEESVFEQHLKEIALQQTSKQSPIFYRTWKVVMGGDQPRYMIAVFNAEQKLADENAKALEIITKPIKQVLRKEKMGSAIVRSDLSSKFSLQQNK